MHHFDQIVGNDQVKGYLERMVAKRAIANSLLFAGPEGIGKSLFAQAFANLLFAMQQSNSESQDPDKILRTSHPDLHVYRPEGKTGMHSIHSLRQLSDEVYLAPYMSKWKVFVIHDAERMLSYSANALLKTFEEPPSHSVIILLSSSPEALLPTILSRCRVIRFHPLKDEEIAKVLQNTLKIDIVEAKKIAAFSEGSLRKALQLVRGGGNELREILLQILSQGKFATYGELMRVAREIGTHIEELNEQEEQLLRSEFKKEQLENMSASQKANLEKEIEGTIALRLLNHAQQLFDQIFSWHRDMHLLYLQGNQDYLINSDYREIIEQSLQRGNMISLEVVQKILQEAKLSLERSTSLTMCLEKLFLKLNLL